MSPIDRTKEQVIDSLKRATRQDRRDLQTQKYLAEKLHLGVAGEINTKFIYGSLHEPLGVYLGQSNKNLRDTPLNLRQRGLQRGQKKHELLQFRRNNICGL